MNPLNIANIPHQTSGKVLIISAVHLRSHAGQQIRLCRETTENSAGDFLLLHIEDNGNGFDVDREPTG